MKALPYLLLVCACIAYAEEPGEKAQANLLKNPGFEEGAEAPADWEFASAMPDNFETGLDADGHGGKRSARIMTKTPKMSGYWRQTVDVEPDTEYLLESWIKLKSGKILMYVSGQGEEPDRVNRTYAQSAEEGSLVPVFLKPEYVRDTIPTDKWHHIELRFTTLPTTKQVTINVGSYFRKGQVLIDDVKLVRISKAPSKKEEGGAEEENALREKEEQK